jgi:thioredoxin reductase
MDQTNDSYEVVVIGGAAAGLAGAVALQDGTAPDVLYAAGRTEVQAYGGQILRGDVDTLERDGELFRIQVQGRTVTARRVLVATGARDELPDIAGLAERWGIDVLHCPYCAFACALSRGQDPHLFVVGQHYGGPESAQPSGRVVAFPAPAPGAGRP